MNQSFVMHTGMCTALLYLFEPSKEHATSEDVLQQFNMQQLILLQGKE